MSELALQLIAENKRTKNTKLDLGRTGLTELPDKLFDCVWLEELILGNYNWHVGKSKWIQNGNNGPLNDFKAIDDKISLLQELKVLNLTQLSLSSKRISSFNFLKDLTGLKSLNISDNQILDYNFLEKLTGLKILDLSDNKILDYSFLENLIGLQSLNLSSNEISYFGFLEKLIGLQSLFLRYNHISDAK